MPHGRDTTVATDAPRNLRAIATTIYRGLSNDFSCRELGNGIWTVQSISEKDGGIVLQSPYVVDIVAGTCTCLGFAHMQTCKHVIAALRRAAHHGRVEHAGVDGLFVVADNGIPRSITESGKRMLMCFLSYEDALQVPRDEASSIVPLEAHSLDMGYNGINLMVGKFVITMWERNLG